jgi:hypothetical protein
MSTHNSIRYGRQSSFDSENFLFSEFLNTDLNLSDAAMWNDSSLFWRATVRVKDLQFSNSRSIFKIKDLLMLCLAVISEEGLPDSNSSDVYHVRYKWWSLRHFDWIIQIHDIRWS